MVDDQIQLYTVPRSNDEPEPFDDSGDSSTLIFAGIGALLLIAVLAVTMIFMRRGGGSAEQQDSVESFGGVEQMDPVEAYVQQLVAQGYEEQMAREYATQYYAQYYSQQKGGGG